MMLAGGLTLFLMSLLKGVGLLIGELKSFENQILTYREDPSPKDRPILEKYDFIVVGSGPSGSAVAARLAENSKWTVLLLEAGEEGSLLHNIPAINPVFPLTDYNWGYKSEYEEGICQGHEGGVCSLPSARGVGGGSLINGMLWTRGPPKDYDSWNQTGWSYKEVLPYFLKSERTSKNAKGAVNLEHSYPTKLRQLFLQAGREFGHEIVDLDNPNTTEGFSIPKISANKGKRVSASTAYLLPIKNSKNFHIAKHSLVAKILIDPKTKTANGVVFVKNGKERKVYAQKEIIISAGAFNTPQLLMLSGIGPKDHLKEMKIPLIEDLPVGNNLQNHIATTSPTYIIKTPDICSFMKLIKDIVPMITQWISGQKGPLANTLSDGLAFLKSSKNLSIPDIEFEFLPLTWGLDYGILTKRILGLKNEVYYSAFAEIGGSQGFSILPIMLHPKSRGMVRLRSTKFNDPPKIFLNSLKNPDDVKVMIEAIKIAINLVEKTSVFKQIGATLHKPKVEGCKFEFGSDKYWECFVRKISFHIHHHCCTAKMGKRNDSVVDERLRVHGIKRLRVADASIMPTIPGAHLMSPCYMIGEKAAAMIKEDWKK